MNAWTAQFPSLIVIRTGLKQCFQKSHRYCDSFKHWNLSHFPHQEDSLMPACHCQLCHTALSHHPEDCLNFPHFTDEDSWNSENYKATSPRLCISKWIGFQVCLTWKHNALSTILHCLQKEDWQVVRSVTWLCHLTFIWVELQSFYQ